MSFYVINPNQTFYDSNGTPRAGGFVTFFVNTTSTKGSIFSDEALTVAQTNPYELDASGRMLGDVKYSGLMTMQVTNSDGSNVSTSDNVSTVESSGSSSSLRSDLAASSGSSLVGFIQSGTDAVERTVENKLRDIVSVRDFKNADETQVAGDGVQFDVTGIQAAIDLEVMVHLPQTTANVYLIDDTLQIGSNTSLVFDDNVTLKMAAATNKKMLINKDAANVNIAIYGGIFDIDETNQTIQTPCIRFDNVDDSYFERVEIKPTKFQAYVGEGSWHFQDCDNNVIKNCVLKDSADEGLYLVGSDNKVLGGEYSDCTNGSGIQQRGVGCLIDGVTAKNNSGSSIGVGGRASKVVNCLVSGGGIAGTQGIRVGHSGIASNDAIISNNYVLNYDGARGIGVNGSNNVVVSNNLVKGCTRVSSIGIGGADSNTNTTVTGNRVVGCYTGISFALKSNIITGNIVEGCIGVGLALSFLVGGIVSNNISRNNGGYGVDLGAGAFNNTVDGNQIYDDADADGIFTINTVGGAGALTLAGALVSGTTATMNHARRIVILSSGNDSGITFTVTGTDADDAALIEVITGGNATTANSVGYFKTITSIVASGAAAANVTIGELAVQTRGIYIAETVAHHIISNNYIYGHTVGPITNPGNNELHGNKTSLTDLLVVDVTLVAGAGGTTVNNENIMIGSRLTLVPTSAGTPPRDIYINTQGFQTMSIGALAGGASDTVKLFIN